MCPNHVEHAVENYVARSIRLSERMKVWASLASVGATDGGAAATDNKNDDDTESVSTVPLESVEEVKAEQEGAPPPSLSPGTASSLDCTAPYELTYGPDEEAVILTNLLRRVQRGREEQALLDNSSDVSAFSLTAVAAASAACAAGEDDTAADQLLAESDSGGGRQLWRMTRKLQNKSHAPKILHDRSNRKRIVVRTIISSRWMSGHFLGVGGVVLSLGILLGSSFGIGGLDTSGIES